MAEDPNPLAVLIDPSRRALYDYVRRQPVPVGREDAAEATGMSRGLAAFHLDKLVDAGLLTAHYRSPSDRPRGRGRTPKVYEPSGDGIALTIPARRYELIADILAEAVSTDAQSSATAAREIAFRRGRDMAAAGGGGADITAVLDGLGFEPYAGSDVVRLRNCPFHALAVRHTALVCDLNQAFVSGVVDGCGLTGVRACLAPRPGACCVEVRFS